MTIKASNMNELLGNNITVKTHRVNLSDFFFVKIILLISNKVYKDLKGNKRLELKKKNKTIRTKLDKIFSKKNYFLHPTKDL